MRWARYGFATTVLAATAACTLLTPLDGLSGGDDDAAVPAEAAIDAPSTRDAGVDAPVDAVVDAGPGGAYREAVMADVPLAYWRLDEPSGTVAKDETGMHDGAYVSAPILGADGVFGAGGAIELPKDSNAHVEIPGDAFRFAGAAPFTVEAWILPAVFQDYQWIGGTENPSSPRAGWSLVVNVDGNLSFEVWRPNDAGPNQVRGLYLGSGSVAVGRWQHVAITYDGARLVGYVDGARMNDLATTEPAPDVGSLVWGCRRRDDAAFSECLDGWRLDELAVYDHPLSAARVQAHHDLGRP